MDMKGIAVILLKITGLVLVVIALVTLPGYFPLRGEGFAFSIGEVVLAAAVALGPIALAGLFLWFFPGTVANRIVAGGVETPAYDLRPLELVALTILGIYLMTHGLLGLVRDGVVLVVMSRQDMALGTAPASIIAHLVATIVEIGIGLALCIGAKGVSRLVSRLRG